MHVLIKKSVETPIDCMTIHIILISTEEAVLRGHYGPGSTLQRERGA